MTHNVAAPSVEYTKKQRSVILFLWLEGVKRSEVYRRMIIQYDQRNVYGWEKDSKEVVRLCDARSDRSWTVTCVEIKEQIGQRIRDN